MKSAPENCSGNGRNPRTICKHSRNLFAKTSITSKRSVSFSNGRKIGSLRFYQTCGMCFGRMTSIKHAADQQAPLLTAEERVTKAVEELEAFHSFTAEQKKWLRFIAEHLKENLSISEQD